ncbi:MAG: hypothetical protein RMK29_12930 [Myxococcales bacterium]|nr:hypothetical protein [Myxococcota bacterium]MDW8282609.1 hypothetical protein [Myxococcales bacterium]
MPTVIIPPTPPRPRWRLSLLRIVAHLSYAGSLALTVSASALMMLSAALAGLAGASMTLGDRLRAAAVAALALGHPVAAMAYRARQEFYARRRQGIQLD